MLSQTILNALNEYKIFIQIQPGMRTQKGIDLTLQKIKCYEEYISAGNEINISWLHSNYEVISKAVKHMHDLIHQADEMDDAHRELNQLMRLYTDFYTKNGIDIIYMSI